jgi:molybdopterin synthase catalytic subunit
MSFRLSELPLDPIALQCALRDSRAGACVTFEGWVRNHNDGRPVLALDYEAFAGLAEREGARIVAEARERFDVLALACVHRVNAREDLTHL